MAFSAVPVEYVLFGLSCAIAGLGGFGRLLQTTEPINARNIAAYVIVHAFSGGGFAGIGYEYLGWKGRPLAMLGISALYGAGVVSTKWIMEVVARVLGLSAPGDHGNAPDKK